MLSLADFSGILIHILNKSHLRDGSCHLDCSRASFYNDALLYNGDKALVPGARGRLRASRSEGTEIGQAGHPPGMPLHLTHQNKVDR